MNKYLEKIASDTSKKKTTYADGAMAGAGIGAAGMVANQIGSVGILSELGRKPSINKSTLRKILKDNKDLNTTFSVNKAFGGNRGSADAMRSALASSGPAYVNDEVRHSIHKALSSKSILDKIPAIKKLREAHSEGFKVPMKKNYIHMDNPFSSSRSNMDIALHELGHARDFHKPGLSRVLKQRSYGASKFLSMTGAGSIAGGAMLGNEKTKKHAWIAPIVSAAPMLRGEGAANYHGYKMVAKHGTQAMKNRFLGLAAKNMIGYGAGTALSAAALYHLGHKKDKKDE